uniref:Reverse transcriptase domain-containing protein n=1 Tax=Nicotiana tabacum TaxID=4097 RepID=A0A1S3XQF6_TOBAC|nr:PREDICTED: uncharacterized protein LOC107767416 [Nicotiana tabacum]
MVTLEDRRIRMRKQFIYSNVWAQHPQFTDLVKAGWEVQVEGCKMFKIVRKLKMLKKALKKLNADHFSNIVTEANMDRVTLKEVRERLQRDPTNRELQLEEANMYAKFRKSSYMVEVYLQQKSKATWLRLGDENTKYFHSVIKHKRLQQTTTQLKDEQGIWQNDPTVIANMLVDCYTDLLGTRGNSSIATRALGQMDMEVVSLKLHGLFGEEVTEAILEFFENGRLLKQLNATIIALIPKVDSPEFASQYRPISCCNVLYKCIFKMICSRLKTAVAHLVAENQAAFVQGRSMVHNVLICHDLLRHYNMRTSPRCLMKIDLRKAYDMVEWPFPEDAMRGFGFLNKFINWMMTCVTITMYSVKVNGESHGFFEGKRGFRQGDPASPLLFILVMEYLSRTLKTMSVLPNFRFHPMCKGLKLTHLIFGDDLMIFCKGQVKSVSRVLEALQHFSEASGLIANMDKSSIFLVGVTEEVKEQLLERTGFTMGEFPIRYLGLPLSSRKWSKLECHHLIDKITNRIKLTYTNNSPMLRDYR